MRITSYRTELDKNLHNVLVKESSHNYPVDSLKNPGYVANMLNEVFGLNRKAEEYVYMVALNIKGRPLGVFEISHGTASQSLCEPRDIFIKALLCGACYIILAHNHPSGDYSPSEEDMAVYRRIKEAGELIGVRLIDNIIIGGGCYYSFNENKI